MGVCVTLKYHASHRELPIYWKIKPAEMQNLVESSNVYTNHITSYEAPGPYLCNLLDRKQTRKKDKRS